MDEFPLLDTPELVTCLQECDFTLATYECISKPTSNNIINLYKQIIDLFADISIEKTLNDNFNKKNKSDNTVSINEGPLFNESISIVSLNILCYKFFKVIGIDDFNLSDLYRPDPIRTRRILSAVVNYARFREERIFDCKEKIQKMSHFYDILESKLDSYNLLKQQKFEIVDELNTQDLNNFNNLVENCTKLENELKKLTNWQENLSLDYESYKLEKDKLLNNLEKKAFKIVELESQRDKLIKCVNTDVGKLDNDIKNLESDCANKQNQLDNLMMKQQNLNTSLNTLEKIITELYDLLKIVSTDLQNSCERETILVETRERHIETKNQLNNLFNNSILKKTELLNAQLISQRQKITQINQDLQNRIQNNNNRITQLNNIYENEIIGKLDANENYIRDKIHNGQIKEIESNMQELRKNFDLERTEIEKEYALLVDHVKRYMKTMLASVK